MDFHEHAAPPDSCEPDGSCGATTRFPTNGRPRVAGAPYADPCLDRRRPPASPRRVQGRRHPGSTSKINKAGWHFPQQRISALWEDVDDFLGLAGGAKRPPEPLFFRANSDDCIDFWLTNLVPKEYELDDFQVRTPTDIIGQHIHLVKFDVTASDGAANGFNYEDGTFAPERGASSASTPSGPRTAAPPSDARNGTFACPLAEAAPASAPVRQRHGRGSARRPRPALVRRPGPRQRGQRPDAAHRLHPRPLRPLDPPAGRPLRRPGGRARPARPGATTRPATRSASAAHDGGPTTWQRGHRSRPTEPRATASSCSSSPTSSSPTRRTAPAGSTGLSAPLRRSGRRDQPAGPRGGRPARPAEPARRSAPGGAAAALPGAISARRPGHHVRQLPQRAAGAARRATRRPTRRRPASAGDLSFVFASTHARRPDASTPSPPSTRR